MMQRNRFISDLFFSVKKARSRSNSQNSARIRRLVHPPSLSLVVLQVLLVAFSGVAPSLAGELEGIVIIGVPEGDSFEVLHESTVFVVRLKDVDAPEISQPYGRDAQVFAESLAHGKRAKVFTSAPLLPGIVQKGIIILDSGLNLSHELLKAGLAWWDRKAARGNDSLWKLEQDARTEHRGLWQDEDPIEPWEWRKGF
jgi:micrococcal nuclease